MVPATVSQLITLNKDTTLVSIVGIQEVIGHAGSVTGAGFFGGVRAPVLQVFLMVGFFFVVVNFALSRLSRRLEIRERQRTGTKLRRVSGLEDQVAAETDLEDLPRL
jgi:ABC-type amino acid transport system permease subunit